MKKSLFLLSTLFLLSCSIGGKGDISKSDEILANKYEYAITEKDQISWEDIFAQEEKRYIVYFYSEYCGYCKMVKDEVLSYYLTNIDCMYFIDTVKQEAVYKTNSGNLIGMNSIDDFYISGTPFIAEITSHVVTNIYSGIESIRLYISTRIE